MSAKRKSKSPKTLLSNIKTVSKPPSKVPHGIPESFQIGLPLTIIALILLLLVIGVVWSVPRLTVDLFTSLAGGRDVVSGHLAGPDDWSFVTGDRVWLNQNWGGDLLFYLCQRVLGYDFLLWLKAIFIGVCALFTILAARRRRVPLAIAFLATGLVIVSFRGYIDLRPNLITLVFAPLVLWMLYRTSERPARIWQVAGVLLLWANIHGGFIFGLGMMFLWTISITIPAVIGDGVAGLKKYWQLAAASILAVLLAGLVNPFGLVNLSHPFVMLTQNYWRNVAEWQPIFGGKLSYGSTWEFIGIIAIIIILSLIRLLLTRRNTVAATGEQSQTQPSTQFKLVQPPNTGVIIFEIVLLVILVSMALESRRFIPLVLLLVTPILAMQIWWLASVLRSRWVVIITGLVILLFAGIQLNNSLRYYSPNNPFSERESFFDRMNMMHEFFPVNLARFVNENHIEGNTYCNWEWEGYLHWTCPKLKVFIGGRAQQVYKVTEFQAYNRILTSLSPWDELRRYQVHFVACSFHSRFGNLINRLVTKGKWVYIYNDNQCCILADPSWPPARDLMERVSQGRLAFPSEEVSLLSRASYILSPAADKNYSQAIGMLEQAVKKRPLSKGYMALAEFIMTDSKLAPQIATFFEWELARLEGMNLDTPNGGEILICSDVIASNLEQYYINIKMEQKLPEIRKLIYNVRREYSIMKEQWSAD